MKQGVKVGNIMGISIEINYSWIIIFALVTWTLAIGYYPLIIPSQPLAFYWLAAFVSALLLFLSLLAHEFAHSYVAVKNNIPIKKITLFIFGGVAQMEEEPHTPGEEMKMAAAGPAFSLFLAIVSYFLARTLSYLPIINPIVIAIFNYLALMNTVIAVFNSIPGFPLDGGRVLRAAIWYLSKNLKSATQIAMMFGKFFATIFMMFGLIYLFLGQYITGIWFLVIGLFLHEAADLSYQRLILNNALVGVPVKEIMIKDVITVSPDLMLDKLVKDYFYKFRHMGFPVVKNGVLQGIVSLLNVKQIPSGDWPKTPVSEVITEAREDLLVCPEDDALDALLQVTKSGLGKLLVVKEGKLLGIIGQRDLIKLFEIKTHLSASAKKC